MHNKRKSTPKGALYLIGDPLEIRFIFPPGKLRCASGRARRQQQSTGLLHCNSNLLGESMQNKRKSTPKGALYLIGDPLEIRFIFPSGKSRCTSGRARW